MLPWPAVAGRFTLTAFQVTRPEASQTLAAVLRSRLKLSWAQAKQLVASRTVRVAGQTCTDPVRRLKVGQRVEVITPKSEKLQPAPARPRLREQSTTDVPPGIVVRLVDDDVVVVEKPPGLTTMRHPEEAAEFGPRGKKFLPATLADLLPRLLNDHKPVIAVHRLDRDTSGLLVFARNPAAAKHLGRQFRAHTTRRAYLALVRGLPRDGKIECWLVRDRGDGRRGSGPRGKGQRATTHVKVLERFDGLTLVECRLETGRTHQVRIHLGELGCPLAGERVYDRPTHGAPVPDPSGARRIMLHAASLGFDHPRTGRPAEFSAAMPEDMRALVTASPRTMQS